MTNFAIGTSLIRSLIEQAHQNGRPVALQVLKVNTRARTLYEKLGFAITDETDTHYIMRTNPDEK